MAKVDQGFDNLTIKQRVRFALRITQSEIKYAIEDGVEALARTLRRSPPPLTQRFLDYDDPNKVFSNETKRSQDGNGVVREEFRTYTRAQFVDEIIKPLEQKHGMTTDDFLKKYHRGKLDHESPSARDYVHWAGLSHVMGRDLKPKTVRK